MALVPYLFNTFPKEDEKIGILDLVDVFEKRKKLFFSSVVAVLGSRTSQKKEKLSFVNHFIKSLSALFCFQFYHNIGSFKLKKILVYQY